MKTNTFFNDTNNTSAGSSYRVPRNRHFTTPCNEIMQGLGRHTNNIAVIDCEKRKKREHEYLSRVHIAELDIPTAAFFPDLDVDDDAASSTSCLTESTSLERRPFKRQALSLETENHDTETDLERHCDNDSDCESDNEIIHILKSVPRLKLRMRATTSSSKDTHPHIIPEEAEENDKK